MMAALPILSCEGCGVCCMHMSSPPYMPAEHDELQRSHPQVYADLMAGRENRLRQRKAWHVDEIPCFFFDMVTGKCRHNDHKPDICRDFERGDEDCRRMRKDAGLDGGKT